MAIGELVTRLTCDSRNFDNNIRRSQREVQEFRRRTEQESRNINNFFNSTASAVSRVSPQIGNLIGSLGQVAPLAAAGSAAFGLFTQAIKKSEFALDELDKKSAQFRGAWDHFLTTLSNGNWFSGLTSSLRDAVNLAGKLSEIIDNLGTLSGYSNLNKSEVEADISQLKELIKSGASKEKIDKQVAKTRKSIDKFDITSDETVKMNRDLYIAKLESIYNDVKNKGYIGKRAGTGFIEKTFTDWSFRGLAEGWKNYISKNGTSELKNVKSFEPFLKKSGLYDSYLYDDYKRGGSEGKNYIEDVKSIIINTFKKVESEGLVPIQESRVAWKLAEKERAELHNSFQKQLNQILEKPGKGGGGTIYSNKQEAPKEKTLQNILDDLDKSLAWNKYLAQNLGEDITGLNLSTLERTANELKSLLKNSTDEEQRKQILSVLKIIYNNINKPKEPKKSSNNADFSGIYGNEIGNLSLNNQSRIFELEREIKDKEIENILRKNISRKSSVNNAIKGVELEDIISSKTAELYNYNADEFLKNKEIGEPSDILKQIVQSIFDTYKVSSNKYLYASLEDALSIIPQSFNLTNNNIKSFIPFGSLSKLNIPIRYPEEFYFSSLASSKFSSGVSSIVKKYTGFDNFNRDFAKNAYNEFDRIIGEDKVIKPEDVNKILYQVYLDTIKKHSSDTPDFFKNSSDFIKFINDSTSFKNDSKVALKLGKENINALLYQELLNSVGSAKMAKAGIDSDLTDISNNSKTVNNLGFTPDSVIELVNTLSKGNIYTKAGYLSKIKDALINRRKTLTEYASSIDTSENSIKLVDYNKNLRLLQLEKEKRSNKGVLSDDKQKEYDELIKDTGNNYSSITDSLIEKYIETSTTEAEKLRKAIEENNSIRKSLEDKINQTDDIGNRIQKEEDENNVLRERQKELSKLSNKYLSVADSANQIGSAFSTLDSKFGDIASVLFNVIGITAEAIGKLIGMATAEGVSSAFKLPWPQNLAAVATVIAAGASAAGQIAGLSSRKYATGGIVSGPGTGISDSIPIRVSNGEMILNHRQQSNLFNLLDKGGSINSVSTGGEVEFKISGANLMGVLRNYNNINNKIR